MKSLTVAFILVVSCLAQSGSTIPWTYPNGFKVRFGMADVVLAGTIEETHETGTEVLQGFEVDSRIASLKVDRSFQGRVERSTIRFKWFAPHHEGDGGVIYAGPPLAEFRAQTRYLVFLSKAGDGWVVAMPVYRLELKLASAPPADSIRDVSIMPAEIRDQELAQELELAAMSEPLPTPGTTGFAPEYFNSVDELIGGCSEPFVRWFLKSPSPELRLAAQRHLDLMKKEKLSCDEPKPQPK